MKTTVYRTNKDKYPYIGISPTNTIILFTSKNTGTVLDGGSLQWNIGHYADDWNEDKFKPFDGSITLNN